MTQNWFNAYPSVVNKEIDLSEYTSVSDFISKCCEKYADRVAFINMDKGLTYREVDQLSDDFAAYLQSIGLVKGDRIAIQMPNLLQYPVAMFGAVKAGLIVVNTNPLYMPDEMEHQFKDSGAKAIVILSNFAYNLEKVIHKTGIEKVIITNIGDLIGGLKGTIVNMVVKYIKKMVPAYNIPNSVSFKQALAIGKNANYSQPNIDINDVAFLQYTGGTTGVSKGAMLSHKNMLANMLQIFEWKRPCLNDQGEVVITALPLYHIFALTVNCLSMMKIGSKNILVTNPRDMKAFIADLKKYPFSVITGVNTLFNGLLNQQDFNSLDFSKLKVAVGGGMAVQVSVAQKWFKLTGVNLVEGYGLTESSPVLTCNPTDGKVQLGTIGVPVPSTLVKIMDDDGVEVPHGEPGEIWATGPQVMKGYWERPNETAKTLEGEWLKTGDIGIRLPDGFFKIVDRKKEMINVSGFNVYPNEVEEALSHHPKILEVGVIGIPDPHSNECVKAFIVKKDPSLTEEEVKAFAKQHLTGYKRPKHVAFKDELPKSNVGKILRRVLKEEDKKNWE